MKKIIILILIVSASNLFAVDGGQVGFSFLKIGIDARAAAMGEAYTALANDASATYWNPAGLASAESPSAVLTHNEWIQDITHNFAAVHLIQGDHNIAFSLNIISVPGIEIRDETPTESPIGVASAQNMYLGMSYATTLMNEWSIGGQVKYFFEKYYLEEADGLAVDIGVIRKNLLENLDWGMVIQNIGKMEKLKNERTELPISLKSGVGYKLPWKIGEKNILAATDVIYVLDDAVRVNFGSEFSFLEMLNLRLGYIVGSDSYNFTAGFGLNYNRYQLSYAFVPFKYDLGNSHRFSLNIKFE